MKKRKNGFKGNEILFCVKWPAGLWDKSPEMRLLNCIFAGTCSAQTLFNNSTISFPCIEQSQRAALLIIPKSMLWARHYTAKSFMVYTTKMIKYLYTYKISCGKHYKAYFLKLQTNILVHLVRTAYIIISKACFQCLHRKNRNETIKKWRKQCSNNVRTSREGLGCVMLCSLCFFSSASSEVLLHYTERLSQARGSWLSTSAE